VPFCLFDVADDERHLWKSVNPYRTGVGELWKNKAYIQKYEEGCRHA
jgi:hypothetical protein